MKGKGRMLLALGALAAAPAWASDKADFEDCDGIVHPGKQVDGMRNLAGTRPYAMRSGQPAATVEACTRALASPRLLPTQSLRRAHLLRARGAARLRDGDTTGALTDLEAAETALGAAAADPFLKRSIGVSELLLKALARAQSGDLAGAVPLARAAAAARPYSLQVQQVAAEILQSARPIGDTAPSPYAALVRLEPSAVNTALIKEAEVGNFAAVVALRPSVDADWPTGPISPMAVLTRDPAAMRLLGAMFVSLHVGYARAATGDVAGARRDLADVRTRVAALRTASAASPMPAGIAVATSPFDVLDKYVEVRGRQIEARIAVAEKRPTDAIGALVASPMPRDAATVELLGALKAALPAKDAGLLPDLASFQRDTASERRQALAAAVPEALIAPETPRTVVDYSRARPNILGALVGGALTMGTSLLGGISRTDGFRSTNNPDGTIKVEFIGNTPSAALVQEMTLLRAAEVARAAGKAAFVITDRKEYSRRLVTKQYGMETGSTPTGFKSELTIRPVDSGIEPLRALDAVTIIDALGPLYYEEKKTA